MISKVGQIMLYVHDQEAAATFWTHNMGFVVVADEQNDGMRWIEIAPHKDAETNIVLHDKDLIAKMDSGLNLDAPSLLFYSEHLEQLRNDLVAKGVTVGDIADTPIGRSFNFADAEANYFAVLEKK